jgi:hypothetical protein
LTWWEILMEIVRLEGDQLVTKWDHFKKPHQLPFPPCWGCIGPMDPLESLQEKVREECDRVHC